MANLANINRGTKYSISGTYTDDSGVAVDITASEIFFTVKSTVYDTDATDTTAIISKNGVITNGPAGEYSITLTPTDTYVIPGNYFYSITIDVTSDGSDIKLLASGKVKIIGHPTNRAA